MFEAKIKAAIAEQHDWSIFQSQWEQMLPQLTLLLTPYGLTVEGFLC